MKLAKNTKSDYEFVVSFRCVKSEPDYNGEDSIEIFNNGKSMGRYMPETVEVLKQKLILQGFQEA